jgi:hypothetical protein
VLIRYVLNIEMTGATGTWALSQQVNRGKDVRKPNSASKRLIFLINTVNADPCDAHKSGEPVKSYLKAA